MHTYYNTTKWFFKDGRKKKNNLVIQRGIANYYNKWNPSTGLGSLFFKKRRKETMNAKWQ